MKGVVLTVRQRTHLLMIDKEFFIIGEGHCVFAAGVGVVGSCSLVKLFMSTQGRYT
jgi:hypothetical protein